MKQRSRHSWLALLLIVVILTSCLTETKTANLTPVNTNNGVSTSPVQPTLASPTPKKIVFTPTPTIKITVSPSVSTKNYQQIIPLEESVNDFYIDNQYWELKHIAWEPDGSALRYAIGQHCSYESKDWQWWSYDLRTNSKEQLQSPQSSVKETLRKSLNLRLSQAPIECGWTSYLSEAPSGTQFVYVPMDVKISGFKLWRSKVDGTGRVFLEDLNEAVDITWSPLEDWILIIKGIADMPIVDIARVDGSFVAPLSSLVAPIPRRSWSVPHFSPDGKKIAYLGGSEMGPEDYGIWIIDLDTWKATQVSKHAGPFQWSVNSQSIYILDQKPFYSAELEGRFDEKFKLDLYRIDLAASPIQETLVANALPWQHTGIGNSDTIWTVSPDGTMVAYIGMDDKGMFGILKIASAP